MKFFQILLISIIGLILFGCRQNRHKSVIDEDDYSDTIVEMNSSDITGIHSDPTDWFNNWEAGKIVTPEQVKAVGVANCFKIMKINDDIYKKINGRSFKENAVLNLDELRYLKLIHHDLSGKIRTGEIICNKQIADDLYEIFIELYHSNYPISSVKLIDEYGADDIKSMQANNTSCFNYRTTPGGSKISKHGKGMAIDINPLFNPYVKLNSGKVLPPEGKQYSDRDKDFPYKIDRNDIAYKEFTKRGFKWGGDWRTVKDYQHFEK